MYGKEGSLTSGRFNIDLPVSIAFSKSTNEIVVLRWDKLERGWIEIYEVSSWTRRATTQHLMEDEVIQSAANVTISDVTLDVIVTHARDVTAFGYPEPSVDISGE